MPVLDLLEARRAAGPRRLRVGRLVADLDRVAALHDDAADRLGDRHDLVDADAALVAVRALPAALRAENL